MSIETVAHELYGLAPEEFTSARNLRAKEAKAAGNPGLAAGVQALRKPTTGAWLINQLVRRHEEDVNQVLDLGARLRAAQGTLGAQEVRDLDRQRRQLTRAVAQQALALADQEGRRVSGAALAEVEETLRSAMVDAAAGAALRSGLLTDTFSSTGLEPVDLSRVFALERAATAPEAQPPREGRPQGDPATRADRERRRAEAERAVVESLSALREAQDAAERARGRVAEARRHRERLETEREEARRRLQDLEAEVAAAVSAQDAADRDHAAADRARALAAEAAKAVSGPA